MPGSQCHAPIHRVRHMNSDKRRSIGHSVFQRLLNHARSSGEDFNFLLFRYGIERLLYRLRVSPHAERFILNGASLFLVWKGQNYRVTKDADLLGMVPADVENIKDIFRDLCKIDSPIKYKIDPEPEFPQPGQPGYSGDIYPTGPLRPAGGRGKRCRQINPAGPVNTSGTEREKTLFALRRRPVRLRTLTVQPARISQRPAMRN